MGKNGESPPCGQCNRCNSRLQNSRFFFSKSVKKSVKRGVRVLSAKLTSLTRPSGAWPVRRLSRSLFSASFQTFRLTASAYLNTQKYGLFCSLLQIRSLRPFPSSKNSRFQNQAKCETFVVKMSFICMRITNYFRINGFALSLALLRVSMGLTDRRKTAKNLVDSRKN